MSSVGIAAKITEVINSKNAAYIILLIVLYGGYDILKNNLLPDVKNAVNSIEQVSKSVDKLNESIVKLTENMRVVDEKITDHEQRIRDIEKRKFK
jgi:predicted  nucleic acid-binding Zn-ribbon protein